MIKEDYSLWALRYLLWRQEEGSRADENVNTKADPFLEDASEAYGYALEQEEAQELACFLSRTGRYPGRARLSTDEAGNVTVRVTRTLRVYIGQRELRARPMAKSILLLFLRHPEGIVLKEICQYRSELTGLYRSLTTSMDPTLVEVRVSRIMDIFNNELNVNISRVNAAIAALVAPGEMLQYGIRGRAGETKTISLDRSRIVWE